MSHQDLIQRFLAQPEEYRQLVAGLSEAELNHKASPADWSIRENLVHVLDIEMTYYYRIRFSLSTPNQALPLVEQDIWAQRLDYQHEPLELTLSLQQHLRAFLADFLSRLSEEQLQLTGVHPNHGPMTVLTMFEKVVSHADAHLKQVKEARAAAEAALR